MQAGADDYLVKPFSRASWWPASTRRCAWRAALASAGTAGPRAGRAAGSRPAEAALYSLFMQAPPAIVRAARPRARDRARQPVRLRASGAGASRCDQPAAVRGAAGAAQPGVEGTARPGVRSRARRTSGSEAAAQFDAAATARSTRRYLNFVYSRSAMPRGAVDGVLVIAVGRDRPGAWRAARSAALARGGRSRQPRQGRVPRHARPRAAQPAGADPHRAAAAAAARASTPPSASAAIIERQVQHLVRLVDDLLDVSRITRGKIELRREPVELADVVARGHRDVEPAARAAAPRSAGRRAARPASPCTPTPARLAQVRREPADQRREVHRARRPYRVIGRAEGDGVVLIGARHAASASTPRCCRASSTCSCRSGRRSSARRAASGSAWRSSAASSRCTAARCSRGSEGKGRGAEFTIRLGRCRGRGATRGRTAAEPGACDAGADPARAC